MSDGTRKVLLSVIGVALLGWVVSLTMTHHAAISEQPAVANPAVQSSGTDLGAARPQARSLSDAGKIAVPEKLSEICKSLSEITFWSGTSDLVAKDKLRAQNSINEARIPNKLRPAISSDLIQRAEFEGASSHGNAGEGLTNIDEAREDAIAAALSTYEMCLDGRLAEIVAENHPSDSDVQTAAPIKPVMPMPQKDSANGLNGTESEKTSGKPYSLDRIIIFDWIGCKSEEKMKEIVGYVADNDHEAYTKAANEYVNSGDCEFFNKGESVVIVDMTFLDGLTQIRRKGSTSRYWVVRTALSKSGEVPAPAPAPAP